MCKYAGNTHTYSHSIKAQRKLETHFKADNILIYIDHK
jgi:hypothetical protein